MSGQTGQDRNVNNGKWQSFAVRNLTKKDKYQYQLLFEGLGVGIVAGIVVASFRILLEKVNDLRGTMVDFAHSGMIPACITAGVLCLIAVSIALLLKFEPDISGSGIPQVEGEMKGQDNQNWWKVLVGKYVGCLLAIGGGLALGREGPSIQLGAMVGKGIARRKNALLTEERMLITTGAGAGLAAAFGAPLAGAIFTLEELHKNFSTEVLISTMAATTVADYITVNLLGLEPVFNFDVEHGIPLSLYWAVVLLGIVLGAFGVFYNRTLAFMQDLFGKIGGKGKSGEYRKMFTIFALSFAMMFVYPTALGSGNNLVAEISFGHYGLTALLIMLVVKFLFSTASFGSGSPGGIFLPLLVLGSVTGGLFSRLLTAGFGVDERYITAFVVISMAGYFSAIVRAPVTGVILITEMTGNFTSLLPLVITSLIAFIVAAFLGGEPVYNQLLERRLAARSADRDASGEERFPIKMHDPVKGELVMQTVPAHERKVVIDSEVHIGSYMDGKSVAEIGLPYGNLIVAVIRDGLEAIPSGRTVLKGGDILQILCRSKDIAETEEILEEKCKSISASQADADRATAGGRMRKRGKE